MQVRLTCILDRPGAVRSPIAGRALHNPPEACIGHPALRPSRCKKRDSHAFSGRSFVRPNPRACRTTWLPERWLDPCVSQLSDDSVIQRRTNFVFSGDGCNGRVTVPPWAFVMRPETNLFQSPFAGSSMASPLPAQYWTS